MNGWSCVEHEIAHVHDVGVLEENDRVAARVPRPVVVRPDLLVPHRRGPAAPERHVGVGLLRGRARLFGRELVVRRALFLLHDVVHRVTKRRIAAHVVAVMVGVDEELNPFGRSLLQASQACDGGDGELTIDHERSVRRCEPADRAALPGEDADAATEVLEFGDGRSLRGLPGAGRGRSLGEQRQSSGGARQDQRGC